MTPWLLPALANHLWQSTLFAAFVWLAAVALRRHGARVRYWLWTAASVKFLVPFVWLVGMGARFEWRSAPAMAQPAVSFVREQVFASQVLAVAAPVSTASHGALLPWLLPGVWLAGSVVVLVWWWRQWLPARSALRAATRLQLDSQYDTRGLTVMSSPSTFEPGVFGIWRPVLLLPEGLVDRLTPAQLNALIAHERCHIRCRDNLAATVHMAVEAIFWFHPLVWWIESRMIQERERACDEAVLRSGTEPDDYAEGILTVCRFTVQAPLACVAGITGSDLRKRIETIMTNGLARELNVTRKLLLAVTGTMAVAGPMGIGLLGASARQTPSPAAARPQFEVASIRRTIPETTGPGADFASLPGGRLHVRNNPVRNLITNAYNVPPYLIAGGPEWIRSDRYDMEAKADGDPSRQQMMIMLQALLEDRFKLKVHRETREGPVYILSVAKGGPRLQESKEGACVQIDPANPPPPPAPGQPRRPGCGNNLLNSRGPNLAWIATRIDMSRVTGALSMVMGRKIIDKTGLAGFYDIDLELPPLQPRAGVEPDPSATDAGASVFTVLRERLGLTLEPGRGPVETLVIDSVERPSEN